MVDIDYSAMTDDQRNEALDAAYTAKNLPLMKVIVAAGIKAEDAAKKALRTELQTRLAETTIRVKGLIDALIALLSSGSPTNGDTIKSVTSQLRGINGTELDGADGVWYVKDFGTTESGCRLMKRAASGEGKASGSRKSGYVAGLPSTADMLKLVGEMVYVDKDTQVTIDKVIHTLPAGMTYAEAHMLSTNGGWRNTIRMALGRAIQSPK